MITAADSITTVHMAVQKASDNAKLKQQIRQNTPLFPIMIITQKGNTQLVYNQECKH